MGDAKGFQKIEHAAQKLTYREDDAAKAYGRLSLFVSDTNGMEVKLQHFEPGCMTGMHTHTCGHGMYVLSGKLHTNFGDFGPGDFVWFDAGCRMEHGTTDEPADLLFITDGPFDITFEGE